ncbi:hypothetical protein IPA_02040 [Ignicoccus pacificus DSM 13166]|uniref:Uncharacterized protein n=1 Tax=Ignicoccus pacificus DSM 13166 TaxID=940294 RepID=A0A977KC40_9CREN|nr:hypothetical protein IPA_02040 [Ignicoccus pacificus DSM 13166]
MNFPLWGLLFLALTITYVLARKKDALLFLPEILKKKEVKENVFYAILIEAIYRGYLWLILINYGYIVAVVGELVIPILVRAIVSYSFGILPNSLYSVKKERTGEIDSMFVKVGFRLVRPLERLTIMPSTSFRKIDLIGYVSNTVFPTLLISLSDSLSLTLIAKMSLFILILLNYHYKENCERKGNAVICKIPSGTVRVSSRIKITGCHGDPGQFIEVRNCNAQLEVITSELGIETSSEKVEVEMKGLGGYTKKELEVNEEDLLIYPIWVKKRIGHFHIRSQGTFAITSSPYLYILTPRGEVEFGLMNSRIGDGILHNNFLFYTIWPDSIIVRNMESHIERKISNRRSSTFLIRLIGDYLIVCWRGCTAFKVYLDKFDKFDKSIVEELWHLSFYGLVDKRIEYREGLLYMPVVLGDLLITDVESGRVLNRLKFGKYNTPMSVALRENELYLLLTRELRVYDISSPEEPKLLWKKKLPTEAIDVAVSNRGEIAITFSGDNSFIVLDPEGNTIFRKRVSYTMQGVAWLDDILLVGVLPDQLHAYKRL